MTATPKLSSRKITKKAKVSHESTAISPKKQSVIHISRLPHEYTERELRAFFGQFGKILKLRLSRSPKTARSRGYGYIQFELPEVARIAAEATNNYFIAGRPIRVEVMNPEAVLPGLFLGAHHKLVDPMKRRAAVVRKGHNKMTHAISTTRVLKRDTARTAKLAAAGVEYEFVRRVITKRPKPQKASN